MPVERPLSDTQTAFHPSVDLIIPVYNEAEAVDKFHRQLSAVIATLPNPISILYVDDGSTDQTLPVLREIARADARVTVIELSRNFGHQAALTAGLDQSKGELVITMDGDGEHPPQLIPEMLNLAAAGYDIVLTQRVEAQRGSAFKRRTSDLFYRLINRIGSTRILPGSADFRLMNRSTVDALCKMREYQRFIRGMVAWIGYRTVILPYTPAERLGGTSKYSLRQMLRLSMNAIFSFSLVPLYISITIGGIFLLMALAEMVYVLSFWISGRQASLAPGWSSLMFVLLVVGGALMITLGLIGIYVGYIFQEAKGRPIYLIRNIHKPRSNTGDD